jgi:hypothetical protein
MDVCVERFLPYTMANGRQYPTRSCNPLEAACYLALSSESISWSLGPGVKEAAVLSVLIVNLLPGLRIRPPTASNRSRRSSHPAKVVVFAHQMPPQSLERLATRFAAVRFIPIAGNPGFAARANRGVRETTVESVLLLNPDYTVAHRSAAQASWVPASQRPRSMALVMSHYSVHQLGTPILGTVG